MDNNLSPIFYTIAIPTILCYHNYHELCQLELKHPFTKNAKTQIMTDLTLSKKRNIFITEKCWGYVFLEYNPTSVNRQLTLALLLVGGLFWRKCGLAVLCRFPLIDKVEYNPVKSFKQSAKSRKVRGVL